MNDGPMRARYAQLLVQRQTTPREQCPPAEILAEAARRQGPEAARLATLDHVMGCPHCLPEFELLRRIEATAPAARRIRRMPSLAIAAAIAGVAATGVWAVLRPATAPVTRGAPDAIEVVGTSSLAVGGGRLAWHPVPGAGEYAVELLSTAGVVLHAARVADTALAVPAAVAAGLPADVQWWVSAKLPDGTTRRSRVMALHVERRD
jgi:hypothetical protein